MSRKSTHTDKKLFDQGRKLLIKKGASQLSVREVCDKAGVNLGMFNYHFKSKDTFIEKILLDIYESFLSDFELVEAQTKIDTLELQLTLMAKFARDNRHLILVLLNDILNGEKAVQKFAKSKMRKHFMILARTLRSCQKSGDIIDAPLPLIMTQIAGSIGLSNLIPEVLGHLGINKAFNLGLKTVAKKLVTDDAIEQRVKIVIRGIKKVDE